MRVLASSLYRPPTIHVPTAGIRPEQRAVQIAPLFARWIPTGPRTGRVVMTQIDPARIPAGWESIQIHVPTRMATCEETDCKFFTIGWTEVLTADGNKQERGGEITQDEAAETFGVFGPREIPPAVIHHPPGTPCPRIHKVPSGIPPLYTINGRPVMWTEFEDSIGGGLHTAAQLRQAG